MVYTHCCLYMCFAFVGLDKKKEIKSMITKYSRKELSTFQ